VEDSNETAALRAAFVALRNVEDWQWGKREPDLREDQLLSAETVRPLITDAIAKIKAALLLANTGGTENG